MTSNQEIRDWYNDYTRRQKRIGVNLRHYTVLNLAVSAGLKRSHHVLEVGCGIGTLTSLLSKYLRSGKILATDISDESVEIGKQALKHRKNIDWLVTDMQTFDHSEAFDFIVLPDVLEHIPMAQHEKLFANLGKALKNGGQLLIHIPHPDYIEHLQETAPEKLQVIDQAIPAAHTLQHAYASGLRLVSYTSYSIFNQPSDYAAIHFLKGAKPKKYKPVSKLEVILRKLRFRLIY